MNHRLKKTVHFFSFLIPGMILFGMTCFTFSEKTFALSDAELSIETPTQKYLFKQSELLERKDLQSISIRKDHAYDGASRNYSAIPIPSLFEKILKDSPLPESISIQFYCADGFSAPISTELVLNRSKEKAQAYLAIENPKAPWPKLKRPLKATQSKTAGPFYLVWVNPEFSSIGIEEWPYQIRGFKITPSIVTQFREIFPDPKFQKTNPIQKGFQVFLKNCFSCHTMNHAGESRVGPDLNLPMNPTQYFTEKGLKAFIRNPKEVRDWPESRMRGFGADAISDSEVKDLLFYFRHMNSRKLQKNQN